MIQQNKISDAVRYAMSEYSDNENHQISFFDGIEWASATEFAEWCSMSDWKFFHSVNNPRWIRGKDEMTSEQLYSLFLTSKHNGK